MRLMRHGSHVCELMSMTLHEFLGRFVLWISKPDASTGNVGKLPSDAHGMDFVIRRSSKDRRDDTRIRVRISRFVPRCRSTSGRATREKEEGGRWSQELNGFCFIERQYLIVWVKGFECFGFPYILRCCFAARDGFLSESSEIFARVFMKVHILRRARRGARWWCDMKNVEILFSLVGLTLLRMSSCFLKQAMMFNMSRRQGSLNSNEVRGGPRRTCRKKAPLHQGSVQRSSCTDRDWTRRVPGSPQTTRQKSANRNRV